MIETAPLLLQFLVPGFIFIGILSFFRSVEIPENYVLLISITISSAVSSALQVINIYAFSKPLSQWSVMLLAFFLSAIMAIALAKALDTSTIKRLMRFCGNKTPNNNIWRDVLDFEFGAMALVSIANSDYGYLGFLFEIEENGPDSWLALSDWTKVKLDENDNIVSSVRHEDDSGMKSSIVLRLSDAKSVMLFYNKDTKVFLGKS